MGAKTTSAVDPTDNIILQMALTHEQLRQMLGKSDRTLYRMERAGDMPPVIHIGREKYYLRESVAKWLSAREEQPHARPPPPTPITKKRRVEPEHGSSMRLPGEPGESGPASRLFGAGIKFGDSFSQDGLPGSRFDYLLANPPFGVEWKPQADVIEREHDELAFKGRFGAGPPRINDGSLLFIMHLISKMKPEGARLAIVFNGSPLFTGSAGSGESEIRRWIIESDWLEAIIAGRDYRHQPLQRATA